MPLFFSDLVPKEIEQGSLMLVRHHTTSYGPGNTPFDLWRNDTKRLELYQRCQGRNVFKHAKTLASFVVTPSWETLFVGLFDNCGSAVPTFDLVEPLSDWRIGEEFPTKGFYYDLRMREEMKEFVGRLSIDWGHGALAWVQYAKQKKAVVQISKSFVEEAFPGFRKFVKSLSEIEMLPSAWASRLREAKGVYVLSCPRTKELYVGSATGEGGFLERWRQHAKLKGDAVSFRSREPSDYQVAILEVAGSTATDHDILLSEQLWMRKLQTGEMGLNGGMLRDGNERPVIVSASLATAARS